MVHLEGGAERVMLPEWWCMIIDGMRCELRFYFRVIFLSFPGSIMKVMTMVAMSMMIMTIMFNDLMVRGATEGNTTTMELLDGSRML
jgi:hypothetical protein